MMEVADSAMVPLVAKLKIQSIKNPNNDFWLYCLGVVYENNGAYKRAITYYTDCQKKNPSSATAYRISNCYSKIGDYASALQHIDNAIFWIQRTMTMLWQKQIFCTNQVMRKPLF